MDTKKKATKRLKSATRYPKKNSDFVVAFAFHETSDDLVTAKQNINGKSPKDTASVQSITPVSETDSTEFNNMNQEQNSDDNTAGTTTTTQNDSDYYSVQEIDGKQKGDAKENLPVQPEVIFSAPFRRHRNKKPKNYFKLAKLLRHKKKGPSDIRNISFKCRQNKTNVMNKLEKFYCKFGTTSASGNSNFCTNSIMNIVSKTRILKKVTANENLLDADSSFDVTDSDPNGSLKSSVSTVKDVCSSSSTLVHQNSAIVSDDDNREDENEPDVIGSVINLPEENSFPFKTDILNVTVAVTYKPNANETEPSNEKITSEFLTSSPPTAQTSGLLTSHLDSGTSNEHRRSELTLTVSDNELSQDIESDVYLFAEANSISNTLFIPDLEPENNQIIKVHHNFQKESNENENKRQALLDSVINLCIYSELNASNTALDSINEQSVERTIDTVKENVRNKGDHQYHHTGETNPTGVLQKSIPTENTINVQRNFELPNENVIRKILKDREKVHKKSCAGETDTKPMTISELWERIDVKLDLTIKRLEDNLAERIVKELLTSTPAFSKLAHPISDYPSIEEAVSAKPLTVSHGRRTLTADESVQCDMVKNQTIDNIMLKMSIQNTKPKCYPSTSKIPLKIKKPKLTHDFVEVLKPPDVKTDLEKGETVTLSTDYAIEDTLDYNRLERLKSALYVPIAFVRENIVIIASVTNFVLVLLCIYAFFIIIMKP